MHSQYLRAFTVPAMVLFASASCGDDLKINSNPATSPTGFDDDTTPQMSYFVSSEGLGNGGDLGGIAGADAHCAALAAAVGSTKTSWVAYLSIENGPGGAPIHARDRIGDGPWLNANLAKLAGDLAELHPSIDPQVDRDGYIAVKPADDLLFWDEAGQQVPGNEHDILTGTTAGGTVFVGRTCNDWTSSSDLDPENTGNRAQVGHSVVVKRPSDHHCEPRLRHSLLLSQCQRDRSELQGDAGSRQQTLGSRAMPRFRQASTCRRGNWRLIAPLKGAALRSFRQTQAGHARLGELPTLDAW